MFSRHRSRREEQIKAIRTLPTNTPLNKTQFEHHQASPRTTEVQTLPHLRRGEHQPRAAALCTRVTDTGV